MAVQVTQIENEPIILARLYGSMDLPTIQSMFQQVADYAGTSNGSVYYIANFHEVEVTFRQLARTLVEANRWIPGSLRDTRMIPVIVAGQNRVRLLFEVMRRKEFGGYDLPVFDTLDEALTHVRTQLQDNGRTALL